MLGRRRSRGAKRILISFAKLIYIRDNPVLDLITEIK